MRTSKPRFASLNNLEERAVRDSHGRVIGRVDDVVIDTESGRVSHLRLALCSPGGAFEGWITVPWSVMRISPDAGAAIEVTVRGEILKKLARGSADRERVRH